ncbi:MAG: peptide chain release factor N(5)-glutamine methyltransferase [Gammaproteobacteria bacterium]
MSPATEDTECRADPGPDTGIGIKIEHALRDARTRLRDISTTPQLDAEILLGHVLKASRSWLRTRLDQHLDAEQDQRFSALLARRVRGEPIAHLTGEREFWSLPLHVTRDTLIPRPETEHLVEVALVHLTPDQDLRAADLGTGSGAIALALAKERPRCQILASDISQAALAVARGNAQRLGLANIEFRHGHWCSTLSGEAFDLIASNPPYVRRGDARLEQDGLQYEPELALIAGESGLESLHTVITQAWRYLRFGGMLVVEHGFDQAQTVVDLFASCGYDDITAYKDLTGLPRGVSGRRSSRHTTPAARR